MLVPTRSLRSLRTWHALWIPHSVLQEHPALWAAAWTDQEPGQPAALSSTSEAPRRPPTGVLAKRRHGGGRRGLVTAPPPGNPSSPPCPTSWDKPRRTLCDQTIETTNSVPRRLDCVCEWLTLPHLPFPRHRAMGQDPQAPHGGREKRKCFIYGTYLIALFN